MSALTDHLPSFLNMTTFTVMFIGAVFGVLHYLNRRESPFASRELEMIKAELEQKFAILGQEQAKLAASKAHVGVTVSLEDRAILLQELSEIIKDQATQDVMSRLQASVEKNSKDLAELTLVVRQSEQTIDRLRQELFSLSKRGNLNLTIGIFTTLTGLLLLGGFVLWVPQTQTDATTFLIGFVPRISLVVLIEIFAYFFLRLYKETLTEIKYFQNEVTSMEAKFLALIVATKSASAEHLSKVIDHLLQTERNFILNKDQTTVDLERARMNLQERTDVWAKLSDLLKSKES
jgi:hypothetical protein